MRIRSRTKTDQVQGQFDAARNSREHEEQQRLGRAAEGLGARREARMHWLCLRTEPAGHRCLTFELSGSRRCGAWPAGRMMKHSGPRAKCHAVGSPLDRGVRHRLDFEQATHAAPPPYPKSYGTWKTLRDRRSTCRSVAGAVACNGARGRTQRQEALRASAVPARGEGTCIHSALTPPRQRSQIQRELEAENSAQEHDKYQRLEPAARRCGVGREARMHSRRRRTETAGLRCLTFELSG